GPTDGSVLSNPAFHGLSLPLPKSGDLFPAPLSFPAPETTCLRSGPAGPSVPAGYRPYGAASSSNYFSVSFSSSPLLSRVFSWARYLLDVFRFAFPTVQQLDHLSRLRSVP